LICTEFKAITVLTSYGRCPSKNAERLELFSYG